VPRHRLPALPPLVEQKLTKTGYTRGASMAEIYQNRVTRNNPVLIPLEFWEQCKYPDDGTNSYENGFIVLVEPSWYFHTVNADALLAQAGLELGKNALLLYRKRADWLTNKPAGVQLPNGKPFNPAASRSQPLGGVYLARVHATISEKGEEVVRGFNTNRLRGAGIRVFEYASRLTIARTRLQLESLIWLCYDGPSAMQAAGMPAADVTTRRTEILRESASAGLLDYERLRALRILNKQRELICPLCLNLISAGEFLRRTEQAEGREVYDLTTTEISLFHIQELRIGKFQHKPYNLGWGHHFCNVVVRDAGIVRTIEWMREVLDNQSHAAVELGDITESVEKAVDR
jgi:BstXI restriction endonuclease